MVTLFSGAIERKVRADFKTDSTKRALARGGVTSFEVKQGEVLTRVTRVPSEKIRTYWGTDSVS